MINRNLTMHNDTYTGQVAEHMMWMRSATNMIDTMVAAYGKSDENRERMDNQIQQLEMLCAMPHISGSGMDLSPYQRAIDLGRSWLAQD